MEIFKLISNNPKLFIVKNHLTKNYLTKDMSFR